MSSINFFSEDIDFSLSQPQKIKRWIKSTITNEGYALKGLNFIFCSDSHLLKINVDYLNHTTLTDIITFDNSEGENEIEGDIFISIERVKENASKFKTPFVNELQRVIIHGVLHLLGYADKTAKAKKEMREKEDECVSLFNVPRETNKKKQN